MNKLKSILAVLSATVILASCGTSNSVVNNGVIQKRKYNKGFFVKSKSHLKTDGEDVAKTEKVVDSESETIVFAENVNEVSSNELRQVEVSKETSSIERTSLFTEKEKEFGGQVLNKIKNNKATSVIAKLADNIENRVEKVQSASGNHAATNISESNSMSQAKGGGGDTGNLIMLIVLIVLIILAFTLLNNLTNGWLGWLVGLVLTVILIVLILRWLGVI